MVDMKIFLLQILYIFQLFEITYAGATIELKFLSYKNPTSQLHSGKCCEGKFFCIRECDNVFTICLGRLSNSGNKISSCNLGYSVSQSLPEGDDMIFKDSIGPNLTNPLTYSTDRWEGKFGLNIQVRDEDLFSVNDLVDIYDRVISLEVKQEQQSSDNKLVTLQGKVSTLRLQFRVYCQPGFYAPDCFTTKCIARDDKYGHYTCNKKNGTKICHQYWYGSNCTVYCKPMPGKYSCNTATGAKICQDVWHGTDCSIHCKPKTGQYKCNSATGDKICHDFWHGTDCSIYCKPTGKYSCNTTTGARICQDFWHGTNCSIYCKPKTGQYICDSATGAKICESFWYGKECNVYCKPITNQYKCDHKTGLKICLEGWKGKDCEEMVLKSSRQPVTSISLSTIDLFTTQVDTSVQTINTVFSTPCAYLSPLHTSATKSSTSKLQSKNISTSKLKILRSASYATSIHELLNTYALTSIQGISQAGSATSFSSNIKIIVASNQIESQISALQMITRSRHLSNTFSGDVKTAGSKGVQRTGTSFQLQKTTPILTGSTSKFMKSSKIISNRVAPSKSSSLTLVTRVKSLDHSERGQLATTPQSTLVSSSHLANRTNERKTSDSIDQTSVGNANKSAMSSADMAMASVGTILAAVAVLTLILCIRNKKRNNRLSPQNSCATINGDCLSPKEQIDLSMHQYPGRDSPCDSDRYAERTNSQIRLVVPVEYYQI